MKIIIRAIKLLNSTDKVKEKRPLTFNCQRTVCVLLIPGLGH